MISTSNSPIASSSFLPKSSPVNKSLKIKAFSFISSSLWGLTAGAVMAQALSPRVSWPIHLTFPLPFLSLLIPGCCSKELTIKERVDQLARSLFSMQGIGLLFAVGLGIASSVFLTRYFEPLKEAAYSDETQMKILLSQGGLLIALFIARYAQVYFKKEFEIDSENEIEKLSEEQITLMDVTRELKESNQSRSIGFQKLKALIENDSVLYATYVRCYAQSKEILLPPYEAGNLPPMDDPIIEEYSKELQLSFYYDGMLTRVKDFLLKNPEFYEALKDKIEVNHVSSISFINELK